MDDIAFTLTLMAGSHSSIAVRLLPLPIISGPTSGSSWWSDCDEWYAQVRRWAIGTSDNFHFFVVHLPGLPFLSAIRFALGYFLYYGVVLCGASLFAVAAGLMPWIYPSQEWEEVAFDWLPVQLKAWQALLALSVSAYPLYGVMFLLDRVWVHWVLRVVEPIEVWRNVLHWLLTGPTLVVLSGIQLWGYCVVAFKGKAACTHHLAGKAALNASPLTWVRRAEEGGPSP